MTDYSREVKLNHNERLLKLNSETGELIEIQNDRKNNIPVGKSKLNYSEFGILNIKASHVLEKHLSNSEMGILMKMINRCDFKTNSLAPLNNDTSLRVLSEEFNIGINNVSKVFKRLFDFGIYLQLKISENSEAKEYWVLNPHIFWRGRLVDDSLFKTFEKTDVTKLIRD